MSIGANILKKLASETTLIISDNFDIDVTDIHHKQKEIPLQGRLYL